MGSTGPRTLRQVLSHDLRGPLAVVVGRCDMLLSQALGPIGDAQRTSLEAILRNAERIERELAHVADHLPPEAQTLEIPPTSTEK